MMGDYHVRFCEGLGGQFPWSTRHPAIACFCRVGEMELVVPWKELVKLIVPVAPRVEPGP
jgi:hypothetical protein